MSNPVLQRLPGVLRELSTVVARTAPAHSLSRTGASTLGRVLRGGPQRITTLADLESVSQPSMTGLVQRLEGLGYVSRADDPSDKRASLVSITAAGRKAVESRRAQHERVIADHLATLAPTDAEQLVAALPALTSFRKPFLMLNSKYMH